MKRRLIFQIIVIIFAGQISIYGQGDINRKIDSLKVVKSGLQSKIIQIDNLIRKCQEEKSLLEANELKNSGIKTNVAYKSRLMTEPYSLSDIITEIPVNGKVNIFDMDGDYWKLEYDGKVGFVKKNFFTEDESLQKFEKIALEKKKEEAQHTKFERLKNKYGKVFANKIMDKKIWLEMTNEMVIDSWGLPDDKNRTVGSWGTNEQWIYGNSYLYLENGILKSWQD
ncbi:MAG: hypothetical protein COA57_11240 [Flavobacteriales bacterium]|nr:MAG: hypothetical protein COA57_11240 [Flavobacteriales bacterium]